MGDARTPAFKGVIQQPSVHPTLDLSSGVKWPCSGSSFGLAHAGIWQLVVHIEAIDKDDLLALWNPAAASGANQGD